MQMPTQMLKFFEITESRTLCCLFAIDVDPIYIIKGRLCIQQYLQLREENILSELIDKNY